MTLISDMLLLAASLGAALYCYVLAGRLRRFTTLETGMGGAIAVLSAQVDEMTRALEKAQRVAGQSGNRLATLTGRAEELSTRLELLVAAMHDLPDGGSGVIHAQSRLPPLSEPEAVQRQRLVRRRSATVMELAG